MSQISATAFAYASQQQAASAAQAANNSSVPTYPAAIQNSPAVSTPISSYQQGAAYQSLLEAHQRQQQTATGLQQQGAQVYSSRPIQYQQQQPDSSSNFASLSSQSSKPADSAVASYQQQYAAYQQQLLYQQQQQSASLQQHQNVQQSSNQSVSQNSLSTDQQSMTMFPTSSCFTGQQPQIQFGGQQQDQYMFSQPPPSTRPSLTTDHVSQQSNFDNYSYQSTPMLPTQQPSSLNQQTIAPNQNTPHPTYQEHGIYSNQAQQYPMMGKDNSFPRTHYPANFMPNVSNRFPYQQNSISGAIQAGQSAMHQGVRQRYPYNTRNHQGSFNPRGSMNYTNRPFLSFYDGDENDPVPNVIYISELPNTITNELLAQQFASAGPLATLDEQGLRSKVWIYKDKMTRAPRGDATITFQNAESSKRAIAMFNGKEMFGNVIAVKQCTKKEMNNQIQIRLQIAQNPKNQNTFLSNETDNDDIVGSDPNNLASNYSTRPSINYNRGRGGYHRGGSFNQNGESYQVSNRGGMHFRGTPREDNTFTGPMRQNQKYDPSARRGVNRNKQAPY